MVGHLNDLITLYWHKNIENLPILGVGKLGKYEAIGGLYSDYDDLYDRLNKKLEDKSYVDMSKMEGVNYGFVLKYNIDMDTHLENAFRYKQWKENEGKER